MKRDSPPQGGDNQSGSVGKWCNSKRQYARKNESYMRGCKAGRVRVFRRRSTPCYYPNGHFSTNFRGAPSVSVFETFFSVMVILHARTPSQSVFVTRHIAPAGPEPFRHHANRRFHHSHALQKRHPHNPNRQTSRHRETLNQLGSRQIGLQETDCHKSQPTSITQSFVRNLWKPSSLCRGLTAWQGTDHDPRV